MEGGGDDTRGKRQRILPKFLSKKGKFELSDVTPEEDTMPPLSSHVHLTGRVLSNVSHQQYLLKDLWDIVATYCCGTVLSGDVPLTEAEIQTRWQVEFGFISAAIDGLQERVKLVQNIYGASSSETRKVSKPLVVLQNIRLGLSTMFFRKEDNYLIGVDWVPDLNVPQTELLAHKRSGFITGSDWALDWQLVTHCWTVDTIDRIASSMAHLRLRLQTSSDTSHYNVVTLLPLLVFTEGQLYSLVQHLRAWWSQPLLMSSPSPKYRLPIAFMAYQPNALPDPILPNVTQLFEQLRIFHSRYGSEIMWFCGDPIVLVEQRDGSWDAFMTPLAKPRGDRTRWTWNMHCPWCSMSERIRTKTNNKSSVHVLSTTPVTEQSIASWYEVRCRGATPTVAHPWGTASLDDGVTRRPMPQCWASQRIKRLLLTHLPWWDDPLSLSAFSPSAAASSVSVSCSSSSTTTAAAEDEDPFDLHADLRKSLKARKRSLQKLPDSA